MTQKTLMWILVPVLAVVAAGGVALTVASGGDELAPGFVTTGSAGTSAVHEVDVELPIGTLTLASGEPLEEIAARRVGKGDDGTVSAEDGAVIVPLSWHFSPSLSYRESLGYPTEFSLGLTSEGDRYDLGTADVDLHEADDSGLLADADLIAVAAGDGRDLAVEVEYEGETQTAELVSGEVDRGRAAPLYSTPGSREYATDDDCDPYRTRPARNLDPGNGSLSCAVRRLVQSPYLPDLGWAPAGSVWSAVDVSVVAPRQIGWLPTGGHYRVQRGPVTVSLDGRTPERAPSAAAVGTVQGGTWVFESEPAPPRIALRVDAPLRALRLADTSGGPRSVDFGVAQDFTLRP